MLKEPTKQNYQTKRQNDNKREDRIASNEPTRQRQTKRKRNTKGNDKTTPNETTKQNAEQKDETPNQMTKQRRNGRTTTTVIDSETTKWHRPTGQTNINAQRYDKIPSDKETKQRQTK